jgi:RNA polymerase sigma factor (sigma-70 family)
MTVKTKDAGIANASERAAAAYRAHYDLLRFIATQRFRVPADDVRGIVHDVFIAFLRNEAKIAATEQDERSWLVGTTCNTCRYYWRKRGDDNHAPPTLDDPIDPVAVADEAERRLLLAGVLRRLPERCRELLIRRYSEGYTPEEIAAWQSLKHGSAKNLISKCLLAARAAFHRLLRQRS